MKKVSVILSTSLLMLLFVTATSQVAINNNGANPDPSAMLEVKSTSKGFLPPGMTTAEMLAVPDPAIGLMIFNMDIKKPFFFDGLTWKTFDGQFHCGLPLSDSRDSQIYNTVQIGIQCWMAENMNIGTRINGSGDQTNNGTIEKYCYDDNETNCNTYGGLYQWNEMMQYTTMEGAQGICPAGWHIATDAEWCTLENYVDAGTVSCTAVGWRGVDCGENLKSTSGWSGGSGTDAYGFTALAGGYRSNFGSFIAKESSAYFWTSSDYNITDVWRRYLSNIYYTVNRNCSDMHNGFSARCLKDN